MDLDRGGDGTPHLGHIEPQRATKHPKRIWTCEPELQGRSVGIITAVVDLVARTEKNCRREACTQREQQAEG